MQRYLLSRTRVLGIGAVHLVLLLVFLIARPLSWQVPESDAKRLGSENVLENNGVQANEQTVTIPSHDSSAINQSSFSLEPASFGKIDRDLTALPAQVDLYQADDRPVTDTINHSDDDGDELDKEFFLPVVQKGRRWASCSQSSFGTMLLNSQPDDYITPADVLIYANDQLDVKGMVGAGAPSEQVRDKWFGRLPGWTRQFLRGTYAELENIHNTAVIFGMADMYECYGYGPESPHQAGDEALDPGYWVPRAEALAEAAGKCLVYGPAVQDYERLATPAGETEPRDDLLANLITEVAPHVDIWIIQLAKYQLWVDGGHDQDGNPFTTGDYMGWVGWWVSQVKNANPDAKVWTQLGIGRYDPIRRVCLPPQPPEYILEHREMLVLSGVDGVWVMPSMPCQLSTDPQDHEYYLQSLATFQEAIEMACGQ